MNFLVDRHRRPSRRRFIHSGRLRAAALSFVLILPALAVPAAVSADPGDIGFQGPSSLGAGSAPSGSKPESKLWFTDGIWWGTLWSTSGAAFHIFRLDIAAHQWVDTGIALDNRTGTRADALWDGSKLYIASHRFSTAPAAGYAVRLYRFSYDAVARTWTPDSGFPATIHDFKTETFVIDKDTTGMLWATWVQNNQVFVSHSNGSDSTWVTPYVMPGPGTTVNPDDISSVISFRQGGAPGRIGVMWSNQVDSKVYFAFHVDGAADDVWDSSKTAIQGPGLADDHINLKSVEADGSGRIYAAIKTGLTSSSAPLIMVLTFTPATMSWTSSVAGRVSDSHTRPIIVIDDEHNVAHVFMTGPQPPSTTGQSGGSIYEKTSPLSSLSFPTGVGTAVIRDASTPDMNDATSTKQNVSSASGLVVLASNDTTDQYWWHYDTLGGSPPPTQPPVAAFGASPTSGPAPLNVTFTDQSTNFPTSWAWDFDNDGITDSNAQSPSHSYTTPGTYTVKLTATNAAGSDTVTKSDLVNVGQPLTFATFNPTADSFVNKGSANKNYGMDANLRTRGGNTPYHAYLQFNPSGISGVVRSVKLRLWVTDASSDGGSVYSVANGWSESGITWNNAPAIGGSPLRVIGATPPVGTWLEADITGAISGDGPASFAIQSASTNSAYYSSRQGVHPPELVVGFDASPPPPPDPPVANFSATPLSGDAPLSVAFSDLSTGPPTTWAWDFDNDTVTDSTAASPTFIYTTPGTYSVKLTVSNGAGFDSMTKTDYIVVSTPPPPSGTSTFIATADARVSQASPASKYGADVALRVRLDPTGAYHTYVRFSVTGISGTVRSAKLRLWCTDASPNGGTAYPTSASWDESTISWSIAPAATGAAAGTAGSTSIGAWAEFDVTSLVTGNGPVNLLVSDGNTNSALYSSREGTNPPQLVVTTAP